MPIEKTENYIRARVRDPGEFETGSMRTVVLSAEQGIKAVMGKLKGKTAMTPQSYMFDVDKWTVAKVKTWLKEHDLTVKANVDGELAVEPAEGCVTFGFDDGSVKEVTDGEGKHLYIEGFATTTHKDRMGDVIDKEFYIHNIERGDIEKAKTVLLDHDPKQVIGTLKDYAVKKMKGGEWGLWVRAQISNADDVADVRTKIKERAYNAFSFRWARGESADAEEPLDSNRPFGPRRIKDGVIIEVSVVALPANPAAELERWYEKALPQPVITEDVVPAAVAPKAEAEPVPDKKAVKQAPGTIGIGGSEGNKMDEKFVKALIATMTAASFKALSKDVQDAVKAVDAGIEARLELEAVKAENATLKAANEKAVADAKAAAEKAATDAAAATTPATVPASTTDEKAADKPLTRAEVQKLVTDAIQAALGKSGKKSDADGTKAMPGVGDTVAAAGRVKSFQAVATPADRELSDDEIAARMLGRFIAGTGKTREQISALVKDMSQPG